MELSIIIPVYNTEKSLLEECIRSIVNSTLEPGSYEILLIDDGSTLDYTDLIDAYSLRHIKTENRGIFSARMLGIENALGDYIAFVDSDDSVSFNYHRPMLEAAKCGADIVYNDWAFHTKRVRYYLRYDSTISGDITATEGDIIDRFLLSEGREHSYSVLWNKVFSAKLLRQVREHLVALDTPEGYNYSEDTLINFLAHKWAKNMKNIHTGYYFYRTHAAQTVSVTSRERLISHIENMSFTLREMERNVDISDDKAHSRIRAWAALMSRTHYSYAKAGGYTDLYEKIKAAYGIDELAASTFLDGAVYHNTVLLPENIVDIDAALLRLWRTEGRSLVAPPKDAYTSRALQSMIDCGKEIGEEKNGEVLPKPRIRLTSKILHNPVLYKLGMLLFPKGSPLRSILKRGL